MGRKLTYEFVKGYIESEGYRLLSTEYMNAKKKLELMCSEGHKLNIDWRHFQQGTRCIKCYQNSLRLTIGYIKEQIPIIAPGYKLLSTEYKNVDSKLEFLCGRGHKFVMDWYHFDKRKQRCPECAGNKKLTIENIRKQTTIIAPGYKLLSTKYINVDLKLKFICDNGHTFFMKWDHFQANHRCHKCKNLSMCGSGHPNWKNYTKEELTKIYNYRCLVIQLTKTTYKEFFNIINPNNLERGRNKYHLDHIFSVIEGFRCNIPPEVIANPYNLHMLTEKENICKYDSCWQTKKMLYQRYYKFKLEVLGGEK